MDRHTLDSRLQRSFEEGIQHQFHQAVSLTPCESSDEEDDEIQIALARSKAESEEERLVAEALAQQEVVDLEKAIAESQASFQEEREIRDLLRVSEQITNEAMRQGVSVTVVPPIEVQEQMLEWAQDISDAETSDDLSIDDYTDEELPVLYKNYRLVPTLFVESEMWPPSAIQRQLSELQMNRGSEDIREWQDTQSEDDRCLVCLTNVATRVAVPCGHRLSCRPCLSSLVRQDNFYSVTSADGEVVQTDRRIPILCCTCRSIVGQIVSIH